MKKMFNLALLWTTLFYSYAIFSSIPLILIHRTNSSYLQHCIWQAKQYNDDIILIGDDDNNCYPDVEHYHMDDYFKEAEQFASVYKHMSGEPLVYERFCFQRWFILKEFMEKHNIQRCFYCDSDVMVYCDINEENKHFKQHDIALTESAQHTLTGGVSFWSLNGITHFCNYMMNYYTNAERRTALIHEYETKKKPRGSNVCDMTIFNRYKNEHPYGNIRVRIDGAAFEHHMHESEGPCFAMKREPGYGIIKNIQWHNNKPYGYDTKEKTFIRFKILHFQGNLKSLMKNYRKEKI